MVLTLYFSQKITDMAGQCLFVNSWAAIARNSAEDEIIPLFNLGFLYPSTELPILSYQLPEQLKFISRRLVLDASKLAKLKAAVPNKVQNSTRVEVVTTAVVSPPVPRNSMGCFTGIFPVSIADDSEIELALLVNKFRQVKTEFCNNLKDIDPEEFYSLILERSSGVRECNGIEAFVSLEEKEMAVFERDEELLAFAKINPSVLYSHSSRKVIALPRYPM
ncbi:hypothetical protein RCOM_1081690 [Ricinus communis]|uniref:Uncharacterized protein n=1 Tax=Ricinus communis TaxID=3988 RepID=B9RML7_RICCO|nr:hypothetical protein RCOM_1081690 [Ricinus communis]